ncbi:hypothetical protein GCM10009077_22050 [Roseibium denhamense]
MLAFQPAEIGIAAGVRGAINLVHESDPFQVLAGMSRAVGHKIVTITVLYNDPGV